jgi:hypothetical protein
MTHRENMTNSRRTTLGWGLLQKAGTALITIALGFLIYGLGWAYSTHRYLKGFSDAIVPLNGSPLEKSEALLNWLSHQPSRSDTEYHDVSSLRDPVNIVQNKRLLTYCGSATNAFVNLAHEAGVRSRRLLLLSEDGNAKHVVAEVQNQGRWIVVDPSIGALFRDEFGRPLSKEELRDPAVFGATIGRMPGYNPIYTFSQYAHVNVNRIPVVGGLLRQSLSRIDAGWEEDIDWAYFMENPHFWPMAIALPLLVAGVGIRLAVWRVRREHSTRAVIQHEELVISDLDVVRRSA